MRSRRSPVENPRIDPFVAPPPAYTSVPPPNSATSVPSPQSPQQHFAVRPGGVVEPSPFPAHLGRVGSRSSEHSVHSVSSSRTSQSHAPPPPLTDNRTQHVRQGSQEDRLAILKRFDTMFLVDDSASMSNGNRWEEAGLALTGVAEQIVKYDSDGIDIHFLCSPQSSHNVRSGSQVEQIFRNIMPVGESTPTEVRAEELLAPYVEACEAAKKRGLPLPKPLNVIVLTDGAADDPDTLAYTIAGFAKRLNDAHLPLTQLGMQFVQIGDDEEATVYLQELDDDLKTNYDSGRDIVDTTPYQGQITSEFLIKVALGGINRRVDRG